MLFRSRLIFYKHLTRDAPMLAPLLDRMVTRNIPQRFTASEALRFFEESVLPHTTEEQLQRRTVKWSEEFGPWDFEEHDRWQHLDASFIEKWAAFREPPLPHSTRLWRFLCRYEWICHCVAHIRRGSYFLSRWMSTFFVFTKRS